ncbi:MAG: regulatory protein LuxR [Gemmatimonadetes bacterium]|nr:regulatory protein LuxR [Gemmatimonadota bacterium]
MYGHAPPREPMTPADVDRAPVRLTARERQVLGRIALGYTSKKIAERLGIGLRTVNCHRENIAKKLGTSSVAALTRYAIENGISDAD